MPENQQTSGNIQLSRHGILGVVLIYAVFASFWILLSDKALEWAFHTQDSLTLASTMKGWLFVAVTSLLLYSLLHRVSHNREFFTSTQDTSLKLPVFIIGLLITAITVGAVIYTFSRHKNDAITRIDTIASLKAEQISNWLTERQQEAAFIQSSTYYAEQYELWQNHGDSGGRERLLTRLSRIGTDWGIDGIILHKAPGITLWNTDKRLHIDNTLLQAEKNALVSGRVERAGIYLDKEGLPHLDYIIPMTRVSQPVPLVILHINVSRALHKVFQHWPLPYAQTDSLLLSQEDGHIVSISTTHPEQGMTFNHNTAAKDDHHIISQLRDTSIHDGSILYGLDFRNIPVIGIVHNIPGTDWKILVKVSLSDINAEAVQDSAWIILAGILALFVTTASLIMIRQNQRLTFAENIRQAQSDRLRALSLLSAIADSSTDAIYAKDRKGRYMLFNKAAERIIGKPVEQVIGRDDSAIFPQEQASHIMEDDQRILNAQDYSTAEEELETIDGKRTFLTTKGPLFDSDHNINGIFGISRDITARKSAEQALIQRDQLLRDMSAIAHVGGWWFDPQTGKGNWTDEVARIHDVGQSDIVTASEGLNFYRGEHRKKIEHAVKMAIAEGHPYDLELELISAKGEPKWVRTQAHPIIEDGEVVQVRGAIQDITDRKLAEFDIERQTEELRQRNEELLRFNRASIDREMDMIELKKEVNRLSEEVGKEPPYTLDFLDDSNDVPEA